MKFERGYISPYFVTNPKTQKCEMENPYILIFDKRISGRGLHSSTLQLNLGTIGTHRSRQSSTGAPLGHLHGVIWVTRGTK